MASANDLRLQVILQAIDRATAPLKRIGGDSSATAKALRNTRDQLKELNAQQKSIGEFRELHTGLDATAAKLKNAQEKAKRLGREIAQTASPTKAMAQQFATARETVRSLAEQHVRETVKLQRMRQAMNAAGLSTDKLAAHERRLRGDIEATNAKLDQQQKKLEAQAAQAKRLATLKAQHGKAMTHTAMLGASGAAGIAIGRTLARPLQAPVTAFAEQETATSQLRASLMRADGSVPAEFAKINELANRLGDRLPGTTADFVNMMTMLNRQGISAQTILGGTGEAAAYLGVQLKMQATEAAEFAAKMQDATATVEGDMMGLMDLIQRTFYLGVDSNNMLQGFTKMAPVMTYLGKEGLAASKMLAPMLVMMDQAGMKGEAAGNAIRKVVQMSMDEKKLGQANAMLSGTGVLLDFYDKKGKFAGFDNLFAQLQKLQSIESDVTKGTVMKKLFGDDAETHQVLNILMKKGLSGYDEVVQKMQAQADLNKRVDEQLKTLSNVWEAATGSFTNMLAAIGETIAPDLKALSDWLGNVASSFRAWVAENPKIARGLALVAAGIAAVYIGLGSLLVAYAGIAGPMLITRFMLAKLGVQSSLLTVSLSVLRTAFGRMATGALWAGRLLLTTPIGLAITAIALAAAMLIRYWEPVKAFFTGVWQGLMEGTAPVRAVFAEMFVAVGRAMSPLKPLWDAVGRAMSPLKPLWDAIAGALAGVTGWLSQLFQPFKATSEQIKGASDAGRSFGQVLATIGTFLAMPLVALASLITALAGLPQRFMAAGAALMDGLVGGITSRLGAVRDAITGAAEGAIGWFKEKLGINSPSRVFLEAGGYVSDGAALGISSGIDRVRTAALAMAGAAAVTMPAAAQPLDAGSPMFDRRPPLSAQAGRAGAATAGASIQINIHPAPGSDPQAIARAVAAELDRRDRALRSGRLSALADIS